MEVQTQTQPTETLKMFTPFEHGGVYTIYYSGFQKTDEEDDEFISVCNNIFSNVANAIEVYSESDAVLTNTSTETCFSFKIENVMSNEIPVWALVQEISNLYAFTKHVIRKISFTENSVSVTMGIHPFA